MKLTYCFLILILLNLSISANAETNSVATKDVNVTKLPKLYLSKPSLPKSVHINQKLIDKDNGKGVVQKIVKDKYGSLFIVNFPNVADAIYYNGSLITETSATHLT